MLGDGESDGYTNDAPDESADAATYTQANRSAHACTERRTDICAY